MKIGPVAGAADAGKQLDIYIPDPTSRESGQLRALAGSSKIP